MDWMFFIPIAVGLLALWRPVYALSALVVLWPSYLWRTNIFGIPTTVLELSLYGILAAVLVLLLLRKLPWHWIILPKDTYWLLSAWAVAWVLATFMAEDRAAALGALKAWWLDPLLFLGLLIICVKSQVERHMVINSAIISGLVVATAGLVQLVGFRDTLQEGRLSSFFAPVANYAAMYLGPLLALNVSLMIHGQRTMWRWIAGSVMALALLLTLSFGGFLAVAAGLLVAWSFLPTGRLKKNLAIGGGVLVVIGLLALTQTKNFAQHFDFAGRSSGSVRQQIWVTSWAIIKQDPWFGVGPNNFEAAYRAELPHHYFPPLEWLVAQPHNLYLALWLETGLLGLIVFLLFLLHHYRLAERLFLKQPTHRNIAIASLAGLTAIVVHGLVDTTFFKNDLAMILAFMMVIPWLGWHPTTQNTVPQ